MRAPSIMFGQGFAVPARPMLEKKYETQTSEIGGEKIKEKSGKLSDDLGKPAMSATEGELQNYINNAPNAAEKKKRVARVNLMKAHKKGLAAKGSKVPKPKKGTVTTENMIRITEPSVIAIHRGPVVEKKKWMQDVKVKRKGICTGEKFGSQTCPPGSSQYALAKTFRKTAAKGGKK